MLSSKPIQSRLSVSPANDKTILVAETEVSICQSITLALEAEGYTVQTATDGQTILNRLKQSQRNQCASDSIDLLIVDWMLPDIEGLEVCRLLRRQGQPLPILMISAKSSETDRVVGLEVGADDYLVKPFGVQELVARCHALLRRSYFPSAEEISLSWKEITLYPESCRVTLRGKEIALTPKEFRLLELFMQYPRRVWERRHLLERVWGEDYVGDGKTVDVHIRWLREKLEHNPSQPEYVQTVRGFGYRLS